VDLVTEFNGDLDESLPELCILKSHIVHISFNKCACHSEDHRLLPPIPIIENEKYQLEINISELHALQQQTNVWAELR
jgi:hypothetical protein